MFIVLTSLRVGISPDVLTKLPADRPECAMPQFRHVAGAYNTHQCCKATVQGQAFVLKSNALLR